MPHPDPNLPIALRYQMLVAYWESFMGKTRARICHWLIQDDERQMIDQFIQMEELFQGRTHQLFFQFNTPFDNQEEYGQN